jgi:hypothetical protein
MLEAINIDTYTTSGRMIYYLLNFVALLQGSEETGNAKEVMIQHQAM